jgi:hypothetical protein
VALRSGDRGECVIRFWRHSGYACRRALGRWGWDQHEREGRHDPRVACAEALIVGMGIKRRDDVIGIEEVGEENWE